MYHVYHRSERKVWKIVYTQPLPMYVCIPTSRIEKKVPKKTTSQIEPHNSPLHEKEI